MRRCVELPEDCVAAHLCPVLDGRPGEEQWSARCPAHDDRKRSLRITVGTRGQRIVWTCHAGCDRADVKRAMLGKGIDAGCIPWNPSRASGGASAEPGDRADALAEIEKLLGEQPSPVEFMIAVARLIWGGDPRTAAQRAGVPKTTYYRHRARFRR
jgi:hypothetical protein